MAPPSLHPAAAACSPFSSGMSSKAAKLLRGLLTWTVCKQQVQLSVSGAAPHFGFRKPGQCPGTHRSFSWVLQRSMQLLPLRLCPLPHDACLVFAEAGQVCHENEQLVFAPPWHRNLPKCAAAIVASLPGKHETTNVDCNLDLRPASPV